MRRTSDSSPATIWPPNRFCTSTPVRNSSSSDSTMPTPGTYVPNSASGRHEGGNSSSDWSRMPDRKRNTQNVIMIGIQISRPPIR